MIGARVADGGVQFRVWAPRATQIAVVVGDREYALARDRDGYAQLAIPDVRAGAHYRYRLDGELYPDPASRYQPEGPFGPSQVVDPAFRWSAADAKWRGIPRDRHVVYELHVGTFTRAGTFAAAMAHLPFLAELGITTIELMPVNEWAGAYNWGYDGVHLFAPAHSYGTPDDLRRFVDRAHALGLAVIVDVVYNHLGPAGNSLGAFAPYTTSHATEWGDAIDFANRGVRDFYIANAVHWIAEYHFDGLRVDATHAIRDARDPHILEEIVAAARGAAPGRTLWIVGENEPQDATLLRSYGFDALWNDDFHHSARVAATGGDEGYLHDYTGSAREFVAAVRHGFLYQGQLYPWQRNPRGSSTAGLGRERFVFFLENHDQLANAMFGERLGDLTDAATLRALTALLLLQPGIPMLFQGQETGSRRPWEFFCAHTGELADAVRRGRAEFVAQFEQLATPEARAVRRDPCAPSTFEACILDEAERDFARPAVALHRDLLALRRTLPREIDAAVLDERTFAVRFGDTHLLLVNLGPRFHRAIVAEPLVAPPAGTGWRQVFSTEHPRYGGHGTPPVFTRERLAIPARSAVLCVPDPASSLREERP